MLCIHPELIPIRYNVCTVLLRYWVLSTTDLLTLLSALAYICVLIHVHRTTMSSHGQCLHRLLHKALPQDYVCTVFAGDVVQLSISCAGQAVRPEDAQLVLTISPVLYLLKDVDLGIGRHMR
jgi:hypothetical protein